MKKEEPTLNEVIERMKYLNEHGYDTYFKGRGNGRVQAIAERWEIQKIK